ncbi:MAG TPA: glycosyltransferase family 39 protein, partial [Acidimicrobiales bacterium]|nr:glycosyltransferase family 39 protein [Acidimicrobiales bacterium]
QDEALYLYAGDRIVGHWLGGPAPLEHYASYFSGYPLMYPVVGGSLYRIGGLALARLFSLACMLAVTAIVYLLTERLFRRSTALYASAVYAFTGVVLFVGRLATFDALCLFFIAAGALVAVYGGTARRPWVVLALGPALVLAVLTKYAGLLFVPPIIVLLGMCSFAFSGWRRVLTRMLVALISVGVAVFVAYMVIDHAALHAIRGSTTNRSIANPGSRIHLLVHALGLAAPMYGLAIFGVLLLLRRRRIALLAATLFGASLLTPAYHIYMSEPISFEKHIAYGLFFAAPLAGVTLDWLAGRAEESFSPIRHPRWVASIAVVALVATLGLQQAHSLYSGWANTSKLGYALHTLVRDGTGRIFAEDIEVSRFDATDVTQEWQWQSFYYPYYIDPSNHEYLGQDALVKGVQAGYYSIVEMSFVYFPDQAFFLAQKMAESRNYDLVAVVPFQNTYGKGHYFIWRTALVPGGGNFTDAAQAETPAWFKACTEPICQPTASGWPPGYR